MGPSSTTRPHNSHMGCYPLLSSIIWRVIHIVGDGQVFTNLWSYTVVTTVLHAFGLPGASCAFKVLYSLPAKGFTPISGWQQGAKPHHMQLPQSVKGLGWETLTKSDVLHIVFCTPSSSYPYPESRVPFCTWPSNCIFFFSFKCLKCLLWNHFTFIHQCTNDSAKLWYFVCNVVSEQR